MALSILNLSPNEAIWDLADILGDMDLDFENFHFLIFLISKFMDFQVPRFPKSGLGRAGLGPGGPGLGLGPGGPLEKFVENSTQADQDRFFLLIKTCQLFVGITDFHSEHFHY